MALEDELLVQQKALVTEVLRLSAPEHPAEARLDQWSRQNHAAVERCRQVFAELRTHASLELAMLAVALREIDNLVRLSAALESGHCGHRRLLSTPGLPSAYRYGR